MSSGEIQYKLHKDNSFVGQGYKTTEEKVAYLKDLKSNGYAIDKVVDYEKDAHKQHLNNYYEWLLT